MKDSASVDSDAVNDRPDEIGASAEGPLPQSADDRSSLCRPYVPILSFGSALLTDHTPTGPG